MKKQIEEEIIEHEGLFKAWYKNKGLYRELHREDGPAIEWANGDKQWFLYGELHREDGPAIERNNGHKEWWVKGKQRKFKDKVYWGCISEHQKLSEEFIRGEFQDKVDWGNISCYQKLSEEFIYTEKEFNKVVNTKVISEWNTVCKKCGSKAYIGFNNIICSNGCK